MTAMYDAGQPKGLAIQPTVSGLKGAWVIVPPRRIHAHNHGRDLRCRAFHEQDLRTMRRHFKATWFLLKRVAWYLLKTSYQAQ